VISRQVLSQGEWDSAVAGLPGAHVLQSWEWGECKARFGWSCERRIWLDDESRPAAAAQILRRTVRIGPFHATLFYVPKGPLLDWRIAPLRDSILRDLETLVRSCGGIQLKIDPDVLLGTGIPGSETGRDEGEGNEIVGCWRARGWRFSPEQVQFRNSVVWDIRPAEAELLAAMKPKARYNIRLAQKHGVSVREAGAADLPLLFRMYAETADRDGFVIRAEDYYRDVWGAMLRAGRAQPLLAEVEGLPVAALILFHFAGRGWYLYGMSRSLHREKMPNHLLQWEAVRWLKSHGCASYDLWGAPDEFSAADPLWGVLQFKLGFGATVTRSAGAWDYAPAAVRYAAYHRILPRLLDLTRLFARRRAHAAANAGREVG
jgi:peptidoglycan pentaglycine glycine transferase (the first glycine)